MQSSLPSPPKPGARKSRMVEFWRTDYVPHTICPKRMVARYAASPCRRPCERSEENPTGRGWKLGMSVRALRRESHRHPNARPQLTPIQELAVYACPRWKYRVQGSVISALLAPLFPRHLPSLSCPPPRLCGRCVRRAPGGAATGTTFLASRDSVYGTYRTYATRTKKGQVRGHKKDSKIFSRRGLCTVMPIFTRSRLLRTLATLATHTTGRRARCRAQAVAIAPI